LAEDAKLLDVAANVIRLYRSPLSNVWLNRGTSSAPAYRVQALTDDDAEFYFIEHLYGYTDIPIWGGVECDGHNADDCVNLHDAVIVVLKKEFTEGLVGLPTWGVAYGNLTTGGVCPDPCGAGPCDCDLVLVDISLDGSLGTSWNNNDFFVPTWIRGNEVIAVEDVEVGGVENSSSEVIGYLAQGVILIVLILGVYTCWRMNISKHEVQPLE